MPTFVVTRYRCDACGFEEHDEYSPDWQPAGWEHDEATDTVTCDYCLRDQVEEGQLAT